MKRIIKIFVLLVTAAALFVFGLHIFLTLAVDAEAMDILAPDPAVMYVDSNGAEAYGWEIEEAMRKIMLEAGGESEEDIRAHVEVDLKQLLYCQTVGGYDDWGTSLYGVTHSHGYSETNTRLWTPEAEPTDLVREIWWDVWNNGYSSDFRVQCYRSGWYHSTTWSIPAYRIGNSFYSISIWQDFSMFDLDENGKLKTH